MLSYYGACWHKSLGSVASFFKAGHPTIFWQEEHLGIKRTPDASAMFERLEAADATTKK